MKLLSIIVLGAVLSLSVRAQQSIFKAPNAPPIPKLSPNTHWGGLSSTVIPKSCKHPYMMKGIKTCRVFVLFDRPMRGTLIFRVWDESGSEEDNTWRILLTNPSPLGIFVQGIPGHRILLEITTR